MLFFSNAPEDYLVLNLYILIETERERERERGFPIPQEWLYYALIHVHSLLLQVLYIWQQT